jgi:hypothetical protein
MTQRNHESPSPSLQISPNYPTLRAVSHGRDFVDWSRILARHQVTDGRGTVLLYQVENEFYDDSADGRRYMQDIASAESRGGRHNSESPLTLSFDRILTVSAHCD